MTIVLLLYCLLSFPKRPAGGVSLEVCGQQVTQKSIGGEALLESFYGCYFENIIDINITIMTTNFCDLHTIAQNITYLH